MDNVAESLIAFCIYYREYLLDSGSMATPLNEADTYFIIYEAAQPLGRVQAGPLFSGVN